jgi:thiol-disulfide isomerase/thioredoxin
VRQHSNWLYWVAGAAIVAIVLAVYFRGGSPQNAGPSSLSGRQAPSFAVPALDGKASGLDTFRGRIVVMNLWASWCPPCRAEMPDLQRLYEAYGAKNVVVLGVDQGESAQRVAAFARSLGIHYPILLDEQQQYGRVYAALGLPTTIVIDPQGTVIRGFDGPLSYDQMVAAITPLIGKRT